jgi:hypothetical protein
MATKVDRQRTTSAKKPREEKKTKNGAAESGDLTMFLLQASLAHLGSTLWRWQRGVEAFSKYSPNIVQAVRLMNSEVEQRGLGQRALLDGVTGFFREMADLREAETVRLQAELEKLAAATPWQQNGPYRRRWHVKS